VTAARNAVAVVFAANGFAFANVISRVPAIRDALGLTPSGLGFVLLAVSAGAVLALPSSGPVVHRLGPARAVLAGSTVMASGLVLAALAPEALGGSILVIVAGFFAVGAGSGVWDVAMNVEGADVERRLGRAIMPRFHAAWSMGTVGGAAIGAGAAWLGVPIGWHIVPVAALTYASVLVALTRFLPTAQTLPGASAEDEGLPTDQPASGRSVTAAAWREPRTILVGLLALGMAFAEGSANDWLAVGLVDGYGVSHALGAAGFGLFVTAMTIGRMAGPAVLARYGRVRALRVGALLVLVGVVVVVLGAPLSDEARDLSLVVAAAGALLWGVGACLGFPVAMSAAADDPARAAARVSVVATIGYMAFLAGPPLLGLLGDQVGVIRALLGVAGAVLLSLVAAGAARPLIPVTDSASVAEPHEAEPRP
jgi:MFS family permease